MYNYDCIVLTFDHQFSSIVSEDCVLCYTAFRLGPTYADACTSSSEWQVVNYMLKLCVWWETRECLMYGFCLELYIIYFPTMFMAQPQD